MQISLIQIVGLVISQSFRIPKYWFRSRLDKYYIFCFLYYSNEITMLRVCDRIDNGVCAFKLGTKSFTCDSLCADANWFPSHLRHVDLPILSQETCVERHRKVGHQLELKPDRICTGREDGKDVCTVSFEAGCTKREGWSRKCNEGRGKEDCAKNNAEVIEDG